MSTRKTANPRHFSEDRKLKNYHNVANNFFQETHREFFLNFCLYAEQIGSEVGASKITCGKLDNFFETKYRAHRFTKIFFFKHTNRKYKPRPEKL